MNKDTNPKDAIGTRKAPLSALPIRVLWRVGLAMLEGAAKYGRHNYRAAGVRASVYFDAGMRHLLQWWEGEDDDADSGLNHIDKLIADLMVLRDSMLQGNWVDDRPPRGAVDMATMNANAARILDLHADKSPKHYTRQDDPPIKFPPLPTVCPDPSLDAPRAKFLRDHPPKELKQTLAPAVGFPLPASPDPELHYPVLQSAESWRGMAAKDLADSEGGEIG